MICIECKSYIYDYIYDEETYDEYDIGYCLKGKETDAFSPICEEFESCLETLCYINKKENK